MTDLSFTVATADLRAALLSVSPHADPDPKFPPLHRIRLTIRGANLEVTATNRYTAALAIVSIEDPPYAPEDERPFDLSPNDVKEVVALFKYAANGDEDYPDDTLRIDVGDATEQFTDVSGLFAGKALQLPRYATEDNFPEVAKITYQHMTRRKSAHDRVITSGKLLGLFGSAAKAYGQPLVIEPTGEKTALVIACGESFLGICMPQNPDEDRLAELADWRSAWMRRFADRYLTMETADA